MRQTQGGVCERDINSWKTRWQQIKLVCILINFFVNIFEFATSHLTCGRLLQCATLFHRVPTLPPPRRKNPENEVEVCGSLSRENTRLPTFGVRVPI